VVGLWLTAPAVSPSTSGRGSITPGGQGASGRSHATVRTAASLTSAAFGSRRGELTSRVLRSTSEDSSTQSRSRAAHEVAHFRTGRTMVKRVTETARYSLSEEEPCMDLIVKRLDD